MEPAATVVFVVCRITVPYDQMSPLLSMLASSCKILGSHLMSDCCLFQSFILTMFSSCVRRLLRDANRVSFSVEVNATKDSDLIIHFCSLKKIPNSEEMKTHIFCL